MEELKICVSIGIIEGARGFRRWEGMGSRGQVVEGEEEISSDTSSSEITEKEPRKAGGELGSIVGWEEATDRMFCRMDSTFSLKSQQSSEVRWRKKRRQLRVV
ncbi:hypothetical protein FKM82_031062 [Ascaphus truei]